MATNLTKSISFARKALVIFIIFAVLSFAVQWITITITKKPIVAPPFTVENSAYIAPNNLFGALPKVPLQSLELAPNTKAAFAILGNAKLYQFPSSANVYSIGSFRDRLGNADQARKVAEKLGFPFNETSQQDSLMVWNNGSLTRTLSYHKILQEWELKVNYQKDPYTSINIPLDFQTNYLESGNSILDQLLLNTGYFKGATAQVDPIIIKPDGTLQSMPDYTLARYMHIYQYRAVQASSLKPNFNPATVVGPQYALNGEVRRSNYLGSSAEFIIQSSGKNLASDLVYFRFKDYSYEIVGTYPMLDVNLAWENIQNNKGYLYWLKLQDNDYFAPYEQLTITEFRIDVNKTKIIYLEPESRDENNRWTLYLQPFYYFSGTALTTDGRKADFAFLVDALSPASYSN
ncbi:MAG: hypothetical protein WCJ58_02220 [bacterium]